jgi:hypothetical protein
MTLIMDRMEYIIWCVLEHKVWDMGAPILFTSGIGDENRMVTS